MKVALVNPPWRFENSIYFGCREPHLPLELGSAQVLLEQRGHHVLLLDGPLTGRDATSLAEEIIDFAPSMTVVTTAPSYLFWRCAPPELRVPREMIRALNGRGGGVVAVGPHGSVTPRTTLRKLGADIVIRGECEVAITSLADAWPRTDVPGAATLEHGALHLTGPTQATAFTGLPPIRWPDAWIARHHHHHHRFDGPANGPGAEVEASRGCPYHCTFCAKIDFRDEFRRRDLPHLLAEIDALIAQDVRYIYFIDEIFLPHAPLLEALAKRDVQFGIQTRIDLWKAPMLEMLGGAGCVSIEAGVESLSVAGRMTLDKLCRLDTTALSDRLLFARQHVPFVQANLIETGYDTYDEVQRWREQMLGNGVWANDPVPMFPYPSSPDYHRRFGAPDDAAWERAHDHYLAQFDQFSDIQDSAPLPLRRARSGLSRVNPQSILLTTDAVGGVWTYTVALAAGLIRQGVNCVLAVLGPQPDATQRKAAKAIEGVKCIETDLPLDWLTEHPAALRHVTRALQSLALSEHADTVHLHSPAYANMEWPVPVIAVAHSCLATWWDAMRQSAMPEDFAWRSAAVAGGVARADGVIAPTHAFASALRRVYGLNRNIEVVANGLPPAPALRATRRYGVLAAGRLWDEAKGMSTLDGAAFNLSAPVWAAGPLEGPGSALFTPNYLQPLGLLTPSRLRDAMAQASIFAAPSRYEPFGLAVLEAAQLGTPLVLSDIPTFREIWHDAAVLVPPADVEGWHNALAALLDDDGLRGKLGVAAARRASRFTTEAMVEGTLSLHRRVLERSVELV